LSVCCGELPIGLGVVGICLNEKNDLLVAIAAMVPFESFRPKLKAALTLKASFEGLS
jgi:hypothetical protein